MTRLSPALVIALTALFLSLGGVSYGVATGSIDTREIRNNTVRSKDVRNSTIRGRDIRDSTVRGKDVRNGTINGVDVNEGSLGTVPTAARLAGRSPAAFASSSNFRVVSTKLSLNRTATLATNGAVSLVATCDLSGGLQRVRVLAATTQANSFMDGTDDHNGPGGVTDTVLQPNTPASQRELLTNTTAIPGQPDLDNFLDGGFVIGSGGRYLAMQGETTALAVNTFGATCSVIGPVFAGSL